MKRLIYRILFSLVIFFLLILASEMIIRKFNPPLTYSDAVRSSHDCYDADPLVPFTTAKNHTCKVGTADGDPNVTASLNSLGYRGREFNATNKPTDKLRVLIIGDSMTFGWGVADDQTVSSTFGKNSCRKRHK